MIIRQFYRVIVFMAIDATEQVELPRCGVAFDTLAPFSIVFSTVDREILTVVIPVCGDPGRLVMAQCAVCGKLG